MPDFAEQFNDDNIRAIMGKMTNDGARPYNESDDELVGFTRRDHEMLVELHTLLSSMFYTITNDVLPEVLPLIAGVRNGPLGGMLGL
jgi:hypothetical protein